MHAALTRRPGSRRRRRCPRRVPTTTTTSPACEARSPGRGLAITSAAAHHGDDRGAGTGARPGVAQRPRRRTATRQGSGSARLTSPSTCRCSSSRRSTMRAVPSSSASPLASSAVRVKVTARGVGVVAVVDHELPPAGVVRDDADPPAAFGGELVPQPDAGQRSTVYLHRCPPCLRRRSGAAAAGPAGADSVPSRSWHGQGSEPARPYDHRVRWKSPFGWTSKSSWLSHLGRAWQPRGYGCRPRWTRPEPQVRLAVTAAADSTPRAKRAGRIRHRR